MKFPTNRTFHGNFPISTWKNFSGNLTCMLEWNCYLTSIHGNHTLHLRQCRDIACYLFARAPSMLATFRKSLPSLIFHFFCDSRFGGFATTLRYLQPSEKKKKIRELARTGFVLWTIPFGYIWCNYRSQLQVPIVTKESKISAKLVGLHHYREVNKFCRKSESRVPYLKNIKNWTFWISFMDIRFCTCTKILWFSILSDH